jgi:hypothetical protein
MPCLVAIIAAMFPRLAIVLLVIFSDYIGRAFVNDLWAFLGFLFLPYTTLAYALAMNANQGVDGIYLVILIVAVLADLGVLGGGASARRKKIIVRKD